MAKEKEEAAVNEAWNDKLETAYRFVMDLAEEDSTAGVEPTEGDEVEQR